MGKFKVVPYDDRYKSDFEKLNRAWIEKFFQMEDEDLLILQHPETYVIKKNGEVFFALYGEEVIGTAAIIPTSNKIFELAKMAVRQDYQGQGIGRLLLQRCIHFAEDKQAKEIFLITNDILKPALKLYLSCGFALNDQNDDERYKRGNSKMNLLLCGDAKSDS